MKKRLFFVCLILVTASLLWANGGNEETDDRLHFIYITPAGGHAYWVDVADGIKESSENFGVKTDLIGPANVDIMRQIEDIEAAIADSPDGIITMALNPSSYEGVINKAVDAGIPVVLLDGDAPESKRSMYVGVNTYMQGLEMAEKVAAATGGQAKIGIVTAGLDIEIINWRIDGLREGMKAYPGREIIDVQDARGDSIQAEQKATAMMQTYPEINVMIAAGASDVPGVGKAIEQMGVQDSILGVAFNDPPQGIDYLKAGVLDFIIASLPYEEGWVSVEAMYRVAIGEADSYPTDLVYLRSVEITKENADTYKELQPPLLADYMAAQ